MGTTYWHYHLQFNKVGLHGKLIIKVVHMHLFRNWDSESLEKINTAMNRVALAMNRTTYLIGKLLHSFLI